MRIFVLAIIAALLWTTPAIAGHRDVGYRTPAIAYCVTEEAARILAAAAAKDGMEGYQRVMNDRDVNCLDSRVHNISVPIVELKSRAFVVTHADGRVFQFWHVEDQYGTEAYIWLEVETDRI